MTTSAKAASEINTNCYSFIYFRQSGIRIEAVFSKNLPYDYPFHLFFTEHSIKPSIFQF